MTGLPGAAVARGLLKVVGRTAAANDPGVMLGALPVTGVAAGRREPVPLRQSRRRAILGLSMQQLSHMALTDLLPADHPLFALIEQVRNQGITIADHDLTLESPRLHKQDITVQATGLNEEPGAVLLCLQDASAARALDRQTGVPLRRALGQRGWRRCWPTK